MQKRLYTQTLNPEGNDRDREKNTVGMSSSSSVSWNWFQLIPRSVGRGQRASVLNSACASRVSISIDSHLFNCCIRHTSVQRNNTCSFRMHFFSFSRRMKGSRVILENTECIEKQRFQQTKENKQKQRLLCTTIYWSINQTHYLHNCSFIERAKSTHTFFSKQLF